MSKQKQIGTYVETAITRWLWSHGFPFAERRPLYGPIDQGDIKVCPGLIIEAKGGKAAENASDGQITAWLEETERERVNAHAELAFLVTKRKGIGASRAGEWWCHMDGGVFAGLVYDPVDDRSPWEPIGAPVRTHLATIVTLLREVGFGDPL